MPTILLVEDHTGTRELWRRQLQVAGWDVVTAASLNTGLAQINGADILVLDWHLGTETGDAILDTWVSKRGGPVVVVTGYDPSEGLYERGAWNVLPKPVVPEGFLTIVRRYCRWIELEQAVDGLRRDVTRLRRYLVLAVFAAAGLARLPWAEVVQLF